MNDVLLLPDQKFQVGKIVCVGRNYAEHINEMDSKQTEDPVLFLKPSTAIIHEGTAIKLPDYSKEVHHEVEMVLLVSRIAKSVPKQDWKSYIGGVGIALDLTLRDLQREAKERGLPWSISKGFDGSCPISDFIALNKVEDIRNLNLELQVNGQIRQTASTSEMIFKVDELVSFISGIYTLEPGDLILTGTPAGVSKLNHGDSLHANLVGVIGVSFTVE